MAIPADATAGAALRNAHAQSDAVVIKAHGGKAFVPGPPGFRLQGNFFSTIAGPYDGTNAGTNTQWSAGQAALIYSVADHTLYYDANGAGAGYQVVATIQGGDAVQATDVTAASGT